MYSLPTKRHDSSRTSFLKNTKNTSRPSRGAMLSDVCLVVVWAATIPGLMWLGAAGGF